MALAAGQVLLGRYRIDALLGQGGFGAVYRVWDINLNRPRALKENLDTSPEAQRQFSHEAGILADLAHPYLPRVLDYFFIAGYGQYLVMDFVEGQDLQDILDRTGGALPEAQVTARMAQVCDALAYLHQQTPPVIHRDVKPANIKITSSGKAVLVDFGIAKLYDAALKTTLGARAVTPGYSPPEQYGQGKTDTRSDIYALGATMYTLLTGQGPVESVTRFTGTTLKPPRVLNPAISPQVENVILKAMRLDPVNRYQSVAELRVALTGQVSNPVPTRRQMGVLTGLLALGVLVLVVIGLTLTTRDGGQVTIATATPTVTALLVRTTPSAPTLAASETPVKVTSTAVPTITPVPTVTPSSTWTATPTRHPIVVRTPATPCPYNLRWNGTECVCPQGTEWINLYDWCVTKGDGGSPPDSRP